MHSRIFVLREVVKGVKLPPINNCSCVTEGELADSFVPSHADYVDLVDHSNWHEDIHWITSYLSAFSFSKNSNGENILSLDTEKGKDFLRDRFDRFKNMCENLSFTEFASLYSSDMFEIQTLLDDECGFWIISISDTEGWWYETLDSFLRRCCGCKNPEASIKFRLEDIFDYHM